METEETLGRIQRINIEDHMKSSYIDYSMSVIVARALPDVRDGLKPVQRRVLFGMNELGLTSGGQNRKSARIVGDVMGKYHPHGDASIYDTMVRMAQSWSLRYMLVNGQGNFGSIDGDSPAAMRYTEARFNTLAEDVLADLDKDTVDFVNNFDDTLKEPLVLPAKAPLLLLNGTSGIAVGMATNMAPHNMTEVCNAITAYIEKRGDITTDELMKHLSGPDFPTGGIILGVSGIKEAYDTGRGRIVVRSKTEIEVSESGRETIVVTEIPYMVNKSELISKMAELVESKRIEGISYINDESDRQGMRIVIKLKMGASSNVVLNSLFKYTALQSSFSVNNIALVDGRPRLLNLKQIIANFVNHRHTVVVRRTKFELAKAQARAHILEGLLKALDFIDEVIQIIRSSSTVEESKSRLIERFGFSDIQASAIVEMRLRQLAGLERKKLQNEYDELLQKIAHLTEILGNEDLQFGIIKDELGELKAKYPDARRTKIEFAEGDINPEDFYPDEDVVITISHLGYIKRTPLAEYRLQNKGGVGAKGSTTREEDFIEHIYVANNHSTMLLFTNMGKCYWLKVYEIPEGAKASKGRAIQNVINIGNDEKICAYLKVDNLTDEEYINNNFIVLGTKRGWVKKTSLEAYSRPRANGIIALTIKEGDELLDAVITNGRSQIMIAGKNGKCVRFNESDCRAIGRTGAGVRGIDLDEDDEAIGIICVDPEEYADDGRTILVVSEHGYGKRSSVDDYRLTSRGAKGVKTMNITDKTGTLVALKSVTEDDDIMIINKSGITIRLAIAGRIMGRVTQGVKLINVRENDSIAAVCVVDRSDEKSQEEEQQSGTGSQPGAELQPGTGPQPGTEARKGDSPEEA